MTPSNRIQGISIFEIVQPSKQCSQQECSNQVVARGLCSTHYHHWRLEHGTPCSVDGCSKSVHAKGLCPTHYQSATAGRRAARPRNTCSEDGCDRPEKASGLCGSHYASFRQSQMPKCVVVGCGMRQYSDKLCRQHYDRRRHDTLKAHEFESCGVENCIRLTRSFSGALCSMHATRLRRHGITGPAESRNDIEGCSVEGCDGEHKARGMCSLHYRRYMKYGDPLLIRRVQSWRGSTCSVESCGDRVDSKGLCNRHYLRFRLYGDPLAGAPNRIRRHEMYCSIDGCDREFAALGFCGMHYRRFVTHGDPHMVITRTKGTCQVSGCDGPHLAHGFCGLHYGRWKKHGDPLFRRDKPVSCTVDLCGRKVAGNGLCHMHYMRFRKWGDPHYLQRVHSYRGVICSVDECTTTAKSRGWCEKHYERWITHGDASFSMWEIDMDVPTVLYRLFDEQGGLLYVGISVRPEKRMQEHAQTKWWWEQVEYRVYSNCNTRRHALELEEVAIRTEKPRYNITHSSRSGTRPSRRR